MLSSLFSVCKFWGRIGGYRYRSNSTLFIRSHIYTTQIRPTHTRTHMHTPLRPQCICTDMPLGSNYFTRRRLFSAHTHAHTHTRAHPMYMHRYVSSCFRRPGLWLKPCAFLNAVSPITRSDKLWGRSGVCARVCVCVCVGGANLCCIYIYTYI